MTYPLLRLFKIVAVAMAFSGTVGVVLSRDAEDRRRFAFWVAGPGYAVAWIVGMLLVGFRGITLLSTWIIAGFALSLLALQVVLYAAGDPARRGPVVTLLALLPLVGTVALMIFRPG